jgi:very-short-patch-repair endonuclease
VAKALLTANEKEFFLRLCKALPDCHILAQVSMGQLIATRKLHGDRSNEHLRARNRFSQKAVDFVIADSGLNVIALVELDDRTHQTERDRQRDNLTRSAGYTTLRYASRDKPTAGQIARDVRNVRDF